MSVFQSQKIMEILHFFKYIFLYFPRESEFRPQKTSNYELKGVQFKFSHL